jgi:hypothetical protein
LADKLDTNFRVRMNHVKINTKDTRKASLNNSMVSDGGSVVSRESYNTQKTLVLSKPHASAKRKISLRGIKPNPELLQKNLSRVSFESQNDRNSVDTYGDNRTHNTNNSQIGDLDLDDAELEKFMMSNLSKLNEVRAMLR